MAGVLVGRGGVCVYIIQHAHGGQRMTCKSMFFPITM